MTRIHDLEKINRTNFRSALEALARPGSDQVVEPLFDSPLLAMASVLLYAEVSHHYRGQLDFELIRALCGSPSYEAAAADYLFFDTPSTEGVSSAKPGTVENPEKSATLIFAYSSSQVRGGSRVRLTGPGIQEAADILLPVDHTFIKALQEKNDNFPLGVDLFFVGDDQRLLGLPRTTTIEVVA